MASVPTATTDSADAKRPAVDAVAPLGDGPRALGGSEDVALDAPVSAMSPSMPPSAAALQQLVPALGMREPDLGEHVSALVCMPRYLAKCAADLPASVPVVLSLHGTGVEPRAQCDSYKFMPRRDKAEPGWAGKGNYRVRCRRQLQSIRRRPRRLHRWHGWQRLAAVMRRWPVVIAAWRGCFGARR